MQQYGRAVPPLAAQQHARGPTPPPGQIYGASNFGQSEYHAEGYPNQDQRHPQYFSASNGQYQRYSPRMPSPVTVQRSSPNSHYQGSYSAEAYPVPAQEYHDPQASRPPLSRSFEPSQHSPKPQSPKTRTRAEVARELRQVEEYKRANDKSLEEAIRELEDLTRQADKPPGTAYLTLRKRGRDHAVGIMRPMSKSADSETRAQTGNTESRPVSKQDSSARPASKRSLGGTLKRRKRNMFSISSINPFKA